MSSDEDVGEERPPPTLAATRSRREKPDRHNRGAAFQKLKEAKMKGKKMNYEVEEIQNVYDIVDEADYVEEVRRKRADGWIVEDDGGYVEDGREIFDDDEDDIYDGAVGRSSGNNKHKGEKEKAKKEGVKGSNIKNMLLSMPSKKKEPEVKLDDDALLGDILGQIRPKLPAARKVGPHQVLGSKPAAVASAPRPTEERNPFLQRGTGLKKTVVVPTKKIDTSAAVLESDPSQQIDEFESCPIEGFDEEMTVDDMDDETIESHQEETKPQVPDSSSVQHRGFVEQAAANSTTQGKGWVSGSVEQTAAQDVSIDSSSLPLIQAELADPVSGEVSSQPVLRMFWIDAHEDPVKHPGVVWLFGKVWIESAKCHVSCCVTVKNITRRIFLAQRELRTDPRTGQPLPGQQAVTPMDLYTEFNEKVSKRYKIMQFKCKPVERSYAFEHADVANVGKYLEVIYSADYPPLPSDLKGETFSHVFGTPQTSLEKFLLDQRLKGPGWLNILGAAPCNPPTSWCKLEAVVTDPAHITPAKCQDETPPLVIMSIKIGTVINPKSHQNEICLVGCLAHTSFSLDRAPSQPFNQHFCLLTKPADEAWPYDWARVGANQTDNGVTRIEKASSERELLSLFLTRLQKLDPDILIGHDILGFDLEVLIHRMHQNKIPNWSRIGRLRRSNHPGNKYVERQAVWGRLVCDLNISAKELIRCKSYELGALVEKCLPGEGEEDKRMLLTPDSLRKAYSSSEELRSHIMLCMRDADQTLRLVLSLNALPLALQISQIVGTVMSKTLRGGRAERIEYLLLHAFTSLDFIVPDKQYTKKRVQETEDDEGIQVAGKGKKKPSYAGGLVLEPKRGFYDKFILLLDFNSLYPSIIQEYNICFTTVERRPAAVGEVTADGDLALPDLPDPSLPAGVLPTQIKKLVDSRRQVKDMLKKEKLTEAQRQQLNIRQLALKLTANSMYGCLGFSFSRFYAKHLAALVTSKGREILLQTRDLIQKMNLDVIYGDTDSVMVNSNSTDYEEVYRLGREIKTAVNKLYRLLELDIDGVFRYMLLLKKKKYAAVTLEKDADGNLKQTTELKGLDIVRRDWSQFAADAGKAVIDIIMTDKAQDTRLAEIQEHLEGLRTALLDGKVALKDLAITKQLTKDPNDYADKKALPHVQVAMRINSAGGKRLKAGDTVSYVICEDGSGLAATQRAYHVDEVRDSSNLRVDTHYYLAQQLHPVVSRLCDPIDGMDSARIAACLGLDPGQYKASRAHAEDHEEMLGGTRDEDRFISCDKLRLSCVCGEEFTMDTAFKGSGKDIAPSLLVCPKAKPCGGNPLQSERMGYVMNQASRLVRRCVQRYYAGWMVCEDPGCTGRTRQLPLQFQRAYPVCAACKKATMYAEYSDTQLYNQLQFLLHLFDMRRAQAKLGADELTYVRNKLSGAHGSLAAYDGLKDFIEHKFVRNSAYATVSLDKIFQGLFSAGAL